MPDIVLMDLQLADGSGIDATRRLFELYGERVRVVMLSESRDPADMIAAVRAGAVGYLTKDQAPERLAEALRGVLRGEAALSRRMAAHLIADVRDTQRRMVLATKLPHRERLTPRQLEILQLIAAGETTTEIARPALPLARDRALAREGDPAQAEGTHPRGGRGGPARSDGGSRLAERLGAHRVGGPAHDPDRDGQAVGDHGAGGHDGGRLAGGAGHERRRSRRAAAA